MSKPNFKFISRPEVSQFLDGLRQSAETIIDPESSEIAISEATRTGPHVSAHLTDLVEQELTAVGYGEDEWTVEDIARHQTRIAISGAFCGVPLRIAGFEQLMNDLIYRYEGGDYSFTPEEARMNKHAEKVRTKHLPGCKDDSCVPEMLKSIMDLVNEMIGDRGEIRILDHDEAMRLIKEKMENTEEEEEDGPF